MGQSGESDGNAHKPEQNRSAVNGGQITSENFSFFVTSLIHYNKYTSFTYSHPQDPDLERDRTVTEHFAGGRGGVLSAAPASSARPCVCCPRIPVMQFPSSQTGLLGSLEFSCSHSDLAWNRLPETIPRPSLGRPVLQDTTHPQRPCFPPTWIFSLPNPSFQQ